MGAALETGILGIALCNHRIVLNVQCKVVIITVVCNYKEQKVLCFTIHVTMVTAGMVCYNQVQSVYPRLQLY